MPKNRTPSQSLSDSFTNGPVAQNVKNQAGKTQDEFADLANARRIPEKPAANGQPLTQYHSLFYRLLSWKNPRATGIAFLATVLFIFASRYLNVIRYIFKGLYMVLGLTAAAEVAGKTVLGKGFTSQLRPKQYYVIPKASLERFLDDAEQLINFFVIEAQRIVFAENVYVTGAAFISAFISYFMIKIVPLWGLTLIASCFLYLGPLVYLKNKEFIDAQIQKTSDIASKQANQFRDLAAQHTGRASETFRNYAGEYTQKAQGYMNSARSKATSQTTPVKEKEFPAAPKQAPVRQQLISSDEEDSDPVAEAL